MRYRFTYVRESRSTDLDVTANAATTASDLADALLARDPLNDGKRPVSPTLTLTTAGGPATLSPEMALGDSELRSGATVGVTSIDSSTTRAPRKPASAALTIVEGPGAGTEVPLHSGSNTVGRDEHMDVVLRDPFVTRQHARIVVGNTIEIIDTNSANGLVLNGKVVGRAILGPSDRVVLGDTVIEVRSIGDPVGHGGMPSTPDRFVRPPRLEPRFAQESYPTPELPKKPAAVQFPIVALLTPILMGGVLFAITKSPASLIFVLMSPLMLIGTWVESKTTGRRSHRRQVAAFHSELDKLGAHLSERHEVERAIRKAENPSSTEVVQAIHTHGDLMWSRRPGQSAFGEVRLGLGTRPSRVDVMLPQSVNIDSDVWQDLVTFECTWSKVESVPVVGALAECGAIGIAGDGEVSEGVARSVLLQFAGLHSPADLTIAACVGAEQAANWEWLKWLPHTMGTHAPVATSLLCDNLSAGSALVTALEDLVASRTRTSVSATNGEHSPSVLMFVTDDAPVERARLVWLVENGPAAGVHVVWRAAARSRLPSLCRAFVVVESDGSAAVGYVADAELVAQVEVDTIGHPEATSAARALAPVLDSGARTEDSSDLPTAISYLTLAGRGFAADPSAVQERWAASDWVAAARIPGRRLSRGSLRALIGQGASEPLTIDLRAQGPHALVGGTTGSGKSELLQTWVLGLASAYGPERVTFLFVDYKGGSAFGECVNLPHSVGLVTDLSPHLVHRVLLSLNAEVRHREHVLNDAQAKDLEAMERAGHPATPPSLVIVVDEFASLAQDVPDFVDGVVNVAQRGRSLGLHLILATQRPAGVIKDNLRANTNLRVALRMADEADSTDVLGIPDAAHFDPQAPGRAALRMGSSRITLFQAAYVGGHTEVGDQSAEIGIAELALGPGSAWEVPEAAESVAEAGTESDLHLIVTALTEAARASQIPAPRRPWLPELPSAIDLAELAAKSRTDQRLVLGIADLPDRQAQEVVAFHPDRDGNLAVFGTGGSGKSGVLRSLCVSAGNTVKGGPVHVYGLDFASQGLHMLEVLPHVGSVITGDDDERVLRLLRTLRATVDERARRYSAAQAATIVEFRQLATAPDEPRILLLIDGLAAFRQSHDTGRPGSALELLTSVAAEGRPVGVHVIVTADRPATMPSALGSLVPRRLSLRQADSNDTLMLGVPKDLFTLQSPPGRGYLDGQEVQIAVLGGSPSIAVQARSIERLAAAIRKHTHWAEAPAVMRLPERVALSDLPVEVKGLPTLGLDDETLGPVGIPDNGTFVITGPPGSGRTSTVMTVVRSFVRARPGTRLALLSTNRSGLAGAVDWSTLAVGIDDIATVAPQLARDIADEAGPRWVIVVEGPGDLINSSADLAMQDLVKAARLGGHLLVAEGDTQEISSSWPLPQALRFSRRGIALQPDQSDGDIVFKTSFPRIRRAEFPQGRGLLVREGRWARVQVAES